MTQPPEYIADLQVLNQIAQTLNREPDVKGALQSALHLLVDLMGLKTGWIFLKNSNRQNRWAGAGYELVAYANLPPALSLNDQSFWMGGCDCQGLCNKGQLVHAYNEVQCSRLADAKGNRDNLSVHASVPLKSGETVLGILNIASASWEAFDDRALSLLTTVGNQMGTAIERARLYDLLEERRLHEQLVLLELSNQLLGRPNLRAMLQDLINEVQRLLTVDACAILMPDAGRQQLLFQAANGWRNNPVEDGRWLPMDERSGPGKVMQTHQTLLVEDLENASDAPWMADWLEAEQFRGHAVVPLIATGKSIGVIVVNQRDPRIFQSDEVRLLRLLANQAAMAIEKSRLIQEEMKKQRLDDELAFGKQIQLSMLPEKLPDYAGWQFSAIYRAAEQVGGDFYDFFVLPDADEMLGIVVADVAGKGIPAALFMALSRTIIRSVTLSGRTPSAALYRANELMLKDSQSELFLTAFYAKLDIATGELIFSNAGHNPPLWYRSELDEFQPLSLKGIVLGILDDILLQESTVNIARDNFVAFYTDGVTEAMNEHGEEFGTERFEEALRARAHHSSDEILRSVVGAVNQWTVNTPMSDDFTLVIIKREE